MFINFFLIIINNSTYFLFLKKLLATAPKTDPTTDPEDDPTEEAINNFLLLGEGRFFAILGKNGSVD